MLLCRPADTPAGVPADSTLVEAADILVVDPLLVEAVASVVVVEVVCSVVVDWLSYPYLSVVVGTHLMV